MYACMCACMYGDRCEMYEALMLRVDTKSLPKYVYMYVCMYVCMVIGVTCIRSVYACMCVCEYVCMVIGVRCTRSLN